MAEPLAVDVREAARRLSLSPATVTKLIADRELSCVRVGRRTIVPVAELERFLRTNMPFLGPTEEEASPQEAA